MRETARLMSYSILESHVQRCGHKINDHKVPIEVQVAVAVQTVKENAILQGLRENLMPKQILGKRQRDDFVTPDRTSYAFKSV